MNESRFGPEAPRLRVLIVDDHDIVVEGLRSILEPEFEVAAVASDGRCAIEAAEQLRPDIILLDISMPALNGFEACRVIVRILPSCKVIMLSMHSDRDYVAEALHSGASGYILKRRAASELSEAIRAVLAGERYVTPLLDSETGSLDQTSDLTARQREVLQLVSEGRSIKEIGGALGISVKTVEFHKAQIMGRLGLRSTAELTRYAIQHGIRPIEETAPPN